MVVDWRVDTKVFSPRSAMLQVRRKIVGYAYILNKLVISRGQAFGAEMGSGCVALARPLRIN